MISLTVKPPGALVTTNAGNVPLGTVFSCSNISGVCLMFRSDYSGQRCIVNLDERTVKYVHPDEFIIRGFINLGTLEVHQDHE